MAWVALLITVLLFWGVCACVLPHPQSRWRSALERAWRRAAARLVRPKSPAADPFHTLRLQFRLGVLADKIRHVEEAPRVYARAHRLAALHAAYDDLLHEACRLAGAPEEPEVPYAEDRRWREEQELATRGWLWGPTPPRGGAAAARRPTGTASPAPRMRRWRRLRS
jgi:hypothetical protein